MYILVLALMTVFIFFEYIKKNELKYAYHFCWILLTLMLCFRYGQGTDYPFYEEYYYDYPYGELAYKYLGVFFLKCGFSFPIFIGFISLFQMIMLNRCIQHYSKHKILSLMLAYHTIYLTYFFSSIRQGIVIALFCGYMIECLEKNNYFKYFITAIIAMLFHQVSVILLLLPIFKRLNLRSVLCISILGTLIGFLPFVPAFQKILIQVFGDNGNYYLSMIDVSILGISERIVIFLMIYGMYIYYLQKNNVKEIDTLLFKIYVLGFSISLLCVSFSLLSSRISAPLKAVEVVLITRLIYKQYLKNIIFLLILGYLWIFTFKNIVSYISQAGYQSTTVISYPYISIFNKEEALRRFPYNMNGIPYE